MENPVITIQSCVITTILYALLVHVFFEIDKVHGEREYFVDDNDNNNDKMTMFIVLNNITECYKL
jgi:hypothetical protein